MVSRTAQTLIVLAAASGYQESSFWLFLSAGGLCKELFGGEDRVVGLSWIIGLVQKKALDARQGPLQSHVDLSGYLKT